MVRNPLRLLRNPLRLAEEHILVEQVRLLLGNVGSSVIPSILNALLLVWFLSNDGNALTVRAWGATVIMSRLSFAYYAQRILASGIPSGKAPHIVWVLMILNAVDGAAWGALTWFTLGTASAADSLLVLAVLAGMIGSALSQLSPLLPVYIIFIVCELSVIISKLWLLGDPAYRTLGLGAVFYIPTLFKQARNSATAAGSSIDLRFELAESHEQLRIKTEIAEAAQREAEQANLAKSRFLAAASHDLRQPIHAQGLFLEVLARSDLSASQNEVLTNARAASEASAGMLNTLLDFSRIEAGVVDPQIRPFHLQPLLNKIENELAPQANAKGLFFRSRETHAAVQSDPALVELILRNLVSNAARYTEHGGVLMACRTRGDRILLEVWDTGIGIAPSQQQEIFHEFHQLGNPERDRRKGLGLGLAIADRLAGKLGHKLTLVSTPQRGSVFRLALPVARVAVASDEQETLQSNLRVLDARVLVIDDDETVRVGMVQLLRSWGCECEAVEAIEDALAAARANRPDIVISDYRLRDQYTGAQAIATLRAEFGTHLPALLITGDTAPERLREARASDVPLLHKPVSPNQLYQKLISMLADLELIDK